MESDSPNPAAAACKDARPPRSGATFSGGEIVAVLGNLNGAGKTTFLSRALRSPPARLR
ncbi:MAG: hypothetical protein R3F11_25965 [Verrucomicrobiales bacterium]